jgi:hypothetical protein
MSDSVETIAADLKRALDQVFFPLDAETSVSSVSVNGSSSWDYINYMLPFYVKRDHDHEPAYFVVFEGAVDYPLTCRYYNQSSTEENVVIQNADDWINHLPAFVPWYTESLQIIKKIASAK